jgi:hypothetical protein
MGILPVDDWLTAGWHGQRRSMAMSFDNVK